MRAYLVGADAPSASRAVFALGRKRARDSTPPFARRIRLRRSPRSRRVRVKALVYFGSSKPVARRKHARCRIVRRAR